MNIRGIGNLAGRVRGVAVFAVACFASLAAQPAAAFQFDLGIDDLSASLTTDLRYTVGIRTEERDPAIGNGIFFDEATYRFDQGDVVTNRLDATPQLNLSYFVGLPSVLSVGMRVSGNIFTDEAYSDKRVRARPGSAPSQLPPGLLGPDQEAIPTPGLSPRVPYSELVSYESGRYSGLTEDRNLRDAEIQDAFVFANLTLFGIPVNLKIGQHSLFYGESLFNPFFGVAYGLGPVDLNKALTIPAVNAQDLFVPVNQISGTVNLTRSLTLGFQHFLDWRRLRAPEGGTYLSPGDPFLDGPDRLFLGNLPVTGPYFAGRAPNAEGDNKDGFSLKLDWRAFDSTGFGFVYRQFDETIPWVHVTPATPENQPNVFGNLQELLTGLEPILGPVTPGDLPTLPGEYRLVYPEKTRLYGITANSKIFGVSVGAEIVYSENRALHSELLNREESGRKARGNVWSGVLNGLYLLRGTELFGLKLWDQATVIMEANWSYLDEVTEREDVYKEVGSDACRRDTALFGSPGVETATVDGCSSDFHIGGAFVFQPIWYRVFPGFDFNATLFYQQQSFENTSSVNLVAAEGYGNGSVGVGFVYDQRINASLNYNFFLGDFRTDENVDGETTITSFNGVGTVDDRDYASLTLEYSF